jgi:hypothetical protein
MKNYKFTKLLFESISNKDVNFYLEVALWSSLDFNGKPLDKRYGLKDIDKSVSIQAKKDLNRFYSKAKHLIEDGNYEGNWVQDFWLSRNGHGAGFFDDSGENGDMLQKIAEGFPHIDLYIGDDEVIYSM